MKVKIPTLVAQSAAKGGAPALSVLGSDFENISSLNCLDQEIPEGGSEQVACLIANHACEGDRAIFESGEGVQDFHFAGGTHLKHRSEIGAASELCGSEQ